MMKREDALNIDKLNDFIENLDARSIAKIKHDIGDLLWWWLGTPTLERIINIQHSYSYLNELVDFKTDRAIPADSISVN